MTDISFKIDYSGLTALMCYINQTIILPYMTREQKVVSTIMMKVEKKLQKKCIDKAGTIKPFKIKLEYYEAFAFQKVCHRIMNDAADQSDYYTENEARMIVNEIDKQL